MIKIGIGYDIHRLVKGRKLFLGGIEISHSKGLLGHSDADVLLHAICDALLGAAGLPDIGECFADTDPKYHNIISVKLLEEVKAMLCKKKLKINNIDAVVIAEEPKLINVKKKMQGKIADVLGVSRNNVNIKAKTNEGLGETGKKNAIAAYAVAMVRD